MNQVGSYIKWTLIISLVGVLCGIASAGFLFFLDKVTSLREGQEWLLYCLPIGGLIIGIFYHKFGQQAEKGNTLIIEEFHNPRKVLPLRMAPLVLGGTLITHLFGGSAGREGTAVQMGASIADQFSHLFKASLEARRTLLMAGMAGGFGSVFGVPFAGVVFGFEALNANLKQIKNIFACALASFVAHFVTTQFGIEHASYVHPNIEIKLTVLTALYSIFAGLLFGLAARLFVFLTHQIKTISKQAVPYFPLRVFIGGGLLSLVFFLVPYSTRYAGLGVPFIMESLQSEIYIYDWLGKLLLTALTIGVGFKGGEVTPLLFIGASLGNTLSHFILLPLPLLAVMGFVGVFAGAAKVPLACTIMAVELFGIEVGAFVALACFASSAVSGRFTIFINDKKS